MPGLDWQQVAKILYEGEDEPKVEALNQEAARQRKRFSRLKIRITELATEQGLLDADPGRWSADPLLLTEWSMAKDNKRIDELMADLARAEDISLRIARARQDRGMVDDVPLPPTTPFTLHEDIARTIPDNRATRIFDYNIVGLLGEGGFGAVYKGVDRDDESIVVAIKLLHEHWTQERQVVERFFMEAMIMASLEHPAIPKILRFAPFASTYVLVQEFVDGQDLEDQLMQGPLSIEEAGALVCQLLEALAYAHKRNVIHRDLKPANLKWSQDRQLKVLDFGIAKILGSVSITEPGKAFISLGYSSPEQLRGETLDGRTDLFSVGIILYQLLNKTKPFQPPPDKSPGIAVKAQLDWVNSGKAALTSASGPVPISLQQFYKRCVSARPHDRYPDAEEALKAFRAALAASPVTPHGGGGLTPPTTSPPDPPRIAGLPTALIVGLSIFGCGLLLFTLLIIAVAFFLFLR